MKWHLNIGLARVAFITYHYKIVWCSVSQDGFFFYGAVQTVFRRLLPGISPTANSDDACHLLVCAEGEMTFEHPAKCECSLLSCAAVRCDYWYFGCLSREDVHMASPPFWVVKKGTLHLALLCKSD